MNPKSLQKTLPGKTIKQWAVLAGYNRCFTVLINGYLYLSLEPNEKSRVIGAIIQITKKDLAKLKAREIGYDCVNVTGKISGLKLKDVYTFIGPKDFLPDYFILNSYISTCLKSVPEAVKDNWRKTTVINNPIKDDLDNPKYTNSDF